MSEWMLVWALNVCMLPCKILKVKTKIRAIWGILGVNLKKSSTLKFIMNISFLPSICIHRSIILIFIEKKYACRFFSHGKYFVPRFSIFISTRILISVTNSRIQHTLSLVINWKGMYSRPIMTKRQNLTSLLSTWTPSECKNHQIRTGPLTRGFTSAMVWTKDRTESH